MFVNETRVTEFILLGFQDLPNFQILLFLIFLLIYIVTVTGNIIILVLVIVDPHLHTPMYFFLGNISFLEIFYTTNIFPRMLSGLLVGKNVISRGGCITQWYICAIFVVSECCLLCVMSYDRYLAICRPLHYATLMKLQTRIKLAATSWFNGVTIFVPQYYLLWQVNFCGSNEIDHYFCDYSPLLRLACSDSDTTLLKLLNSLVAAIFVFFPFLFTLVSYVFVINTILKFPSTIGRQKAFSTCSSHLIVITFFYGTLIIVYMLPRSDENTGTTKFWSLLYLVLPPLLNPFIYSLRNKEVRKAFRNLIGRIMHFGLIP